MTPRIIAVLAVVALIGAGVVWLTSIIIQAERAKTLQVAVEKMVERDKVKKIVRDATAEDLCRLLGGKSIDGACQ